MSSCRTSRRRLAPSAARTVISRWRALARDSSRFETLAQAISSSSATAPSRTQMSLPIELGNVSLNGSRPTRHWSGNSRRLALLQVRDDRPQIGFRLRVA